MRLWYFEGLHVLGDTTQTNTNGSRIQQPRYWENIERFRDPTLHCINQELQRAMRA